MTDFRTHIRTVGRRKALRGIPFRICNQPATVCMLDAAGAIPHIAREICRAESLRRGNPMRRIAYVGLAAIIAASTFAPGLTSPAVAGSWEIRACDDERVLRRIVRRFRHQVRHVPHLPDVEIESFSSVHQHRYHQERHGHPIARRYCHATAHLSDGRHRKVWYLIEGKMGFASIGNGVEFCVSGFDRWMVYNGSCRVLR